MRTTLKITTLLILPLALASCAQYFARTDTCDDASAAQDEDCAAAIVGQDSGLPDVLGGTSIAQEDIAGILAVVAITLLGANGGGSSSTPTTTP